MAAYLLVCFCPFIIDAYTNLCEFLRMDKGFLAGLPWLRDKRLALFVN